MANHPIRTVPMQVLALGMSRTGTASMRKALQELGFNHTYHGFDTIEHPEDLLLWEKAADAKFSGKGTWGREEFDQLLGHCAAVTDMPCAIFSEELLQAYPEVRHVDYVDQYIPF